MPSLFDGINDAETDQLIQKFSDFLDKCDKNADAFPVSIREVVIGAYLYGHRTAGENRDPLGVEIL
ncbi:hypothetical protein PXH69_24645 [Rhodococcus qingshengii]|uniref:Uncharacterized protein n=1 Tax=Rhodococcus qingshengii TaxID=334542 RepID=A0AAW6LPT1_RHOSG|nr:hypothetical protein [Rhodococcus qingshengii]MDE8648161.1 hypothetical protein [Rhodococcus qingshengii]